MVNPFPNICLSNVEGAPFMCLTSISIYIDYWKSFMKFGAKKSHEMITFLELLRQGMQTWDVIQTLQLCSNSPNSIHEEKL